MLDQLGNVRIEADQRRDTVYSRNGPSLPLSKTDAFALHSTSIPERAGNVSGLSFYPPKRVLLDTRADSSMKIQLPHILPPEPIPRVTPAQRRILLLP